MTRYWRVLDPQSHNQMFISTYTIESLLRTIGIYVCMYFVYNAILVIQHTRTSASLPWQSLKTGSKKPGVQFLVPDWRDKVDYVIGLSYRPIRLHRHAGRYGNPTALLASWQKRITLKKIKRQGEGQGGEGRVLVYIMKRAQLDVIAS
jgi:hypothetical protein